MAQVVISGEFYNWYSRQHQSKKRSGKADKQTAETKEWVDCYLAWTQHIPSHRKLILEIIAAVCLIGGGLLLVYKLLNDKRFFHNDSSGGGQKVFRGK